MGNLGEIIRLLVLASAAALLYFNRREIEDAIERFRNDFPRGGPPTPMHPSPADDGALLRRRSRKIEN